MKRLLFKSIAAFLLLTFFGTATMQAQCETWIDSPKKNQAEEAHVLYRDFLKAEDYDQAFTYWKKAYDLAPAADGQRPFHYTDGRKIFKHKFKNATDDAKKKEYKEMILKLYDQERECYKNDAYLLGRKGFDMFYELNSLYSENLAVLEEAMEVGGNDVEYIIFDPAARIAVYQYQNQLLDKEKVRDLNIRMNEIADYNIENNEEYGEAFQTSKDAMNAIFVPIEDEIFDCAYFKEKLVPKYKENPEDLEVIKYVYNKLRQQECDEADPVMQELKGKYESIAAAINAAKQAEFEANNPGVAARKLYEEGDYNGAINKYEEAISQESDPSTQAGYHFSIASIQFRKLNQYGAARESARKAASLRSGWGRPYMLIGDMYASTSRNCGDDWNQRLAVLAAMEKYSYAKSIDSEVADEARSRIGKYAAAKPTKAEGFMRKVKEGSSVNVGCWIGESVRVSYQ